MKKLILAIMMCAISYGYAKSYIDHGVKYLYIDDSDNEVTCHVQSLCDIALIKNDTFVNWIMTKGAAWVDSARKKTSYIDNNGRTHVILQAIDVDDDNPVILIGADNQYHFNLSATNRKTINRYVFIEHNTNEYNSQNSIIDNGLALNFSNKTFKGSYSLRGDVNSTIRPLSVFNDGRKTYIQMNNEISQTDLPTIYIVDEDDKLQTVAGVRYRKPYFVIDGVKSRYALIVGNSTSNNQLRVDIKLKS